MKKTHIVVHHTAVSYNKNPDQFEATNNYHKGLNFPKSIMGYYVGYHYEISKNGRLYQGRHDDEMGAHTTQENMNEDSIGICLDGDFDIENPTEVQCITLLKIIRELQKKHGIEDGNVDPHRRYASYKSCWGKRVPDDIIGYLEKRLIHLNTPEWARKSMIAFDAKGIMTNKLPNQALTRAEMAVIGERMIEYIFKNLKNNE